MLMAGVCLNDEFRRACTHVPVWPFCNSSCMPPERGVTPKQSIAAECERRGRSEVVSGCMQLLAGGSVDDGLIVALAAGAARPILDERAGGRTGYWPRVWAARGLLHVWDDRATRSIIRAALDESWRVREKVAQIVAAHRVDAALSAVVKLR